MIEREFVSERIKHLKIKEVIDDEINNYAGVGDIEIEKTPLGEKIVIHAVRPSLVIGRGGETIKNITGIIKRNFKLENPQIEVKEIENPFLSAQVVAKRIVADLERFGSSRFKVIGHKAIQNIMHAGAMGAEIRITGRGLPSSRAKSWRFFDGYLKKCGDVALTQIDSAKVSANLRAATVGVKVSIMPPNAALPDHIKVVAGQKVEIALEIPVKKAEVTVETLKEPPKEEAKPELKSEPKTKKAKVKKSVVAPKEKAESKPEEKETKTTKKSEEQSKKEEKPVEKPKNTGTKKKLLTEKPAVVASETDTKKTDGKSAKAKKVKEVKKE